MAISRLNRVNHASLAFGRIGYLKDTETQDRDFNAIVHSYSLHHFLLLFLLLMVLLWG